jgi:hypothetical protein
MLASGFGNDWILDGVATVEQEQFVFIHIHFVGPRLPVVRSYPLLPSALHHR